MSESYRPVESETGQRGMSVHVSRWQHQRLPIDGMAQALGARQGAWVAHEHEDRLAGLVWLLVLCPDYEEVPWGAEVWSAAPGDPRLAANGGPRPSEQTG